MAAVDSIKKAVKALRLVSGVGGPNFRLRLCPPESRSLWSDVFRAIVKNNESVRSNSGQSIQRFAGRRRGELDAGRVRVRASDNK